MADCNEKWSSDVCDDDWILWWLCKKKKNSGFGLLFWLFLGILIKGLAKCGCVPDCEGWKCGDDGCGGQCGECPFAYVGQICQDGKCQFPPCGSITSEGCCDGQTLKFCNKGALWTESCPEGHECRWNPYGGGYYCAEEGKGLAADPTGQFPNCPGGCLPACQGKECGDDGCSGVCGTCDAPQEQCVNGICKCFPSCEGKNCGSDGCGGECGTCPDGYACDQSNECKPDCDVLCLSKQCGHAGLEDECECGHCEEGYSCDIGDGSCLPDCQYLCAGKKCGSAGVDGECNCGTCGTGEVCSDDGNCCALPADLLGSYNALTNHPTIAQALAQGPLQQDALYEAIAELECGAVAHWDEFESLDIPFLTKAQAEKVWTRRVAWALSAEIHEQFPWRLVDYPVEQLIALLGFHVADSPFEPDSYEPELTAPDHYGWDFSLCPDGVHYTFRGSVWCSSPLITWDMATQVMSDLNFGTPDDAEKAVAQMVLHLTLNFKHAGASFWQTVPTHTGCGLPNINLSWFMANKETVYDDQVVAIVRQIMRVMNIPTVVGHGYTGAFAKWWWGSKYYAGQEIGIAFPSVGQVLTHGDSVYEFVCPPEGVLLPWQEYCDWAATLSQSALGTSYAQVCSAVCNYELWKRRRRFLSLFESYRDDFWWSVIVNDFIGPYLIGAQFPKADLVEQLCQGCTIDFESDPEVGKWIVCLISLYEVYGAAGSQQYKCPDGCECGQPECDCS